MRLRALIASTIWFLLGGFVFCGHVSAQKKPAPLAGPLLTRTITRHETARFLPGGTVTVSGAPIGSITIEGWQRSEVDIAAEIELHAATEEDLSRLATVNNFVIDADANHLRILSTGTHDRAFMKRFAPKFPKALIGLSWKIDYHLRVPALTDLEINAGNGPVKLAGVEGALRLSALQSDAILSLTGGETHVTIQQGSVVFQLDSRSWHGLGADVKLAGGELHVILPSDVSADINANILGVGEIEIKAIKLEPLGKVGITPRSVHARAGNGGATLSFTVGSGKIRIGPAIGSGRQGLD